MQAIEFDAVVQDQAIPLPSPAAVATGQAVRVIVMYEPRRDTDQAGQGDPHSGTGPPPADSAGLRTAHPRRGP